MRAKKYVIESSKKEKHILSRQDKLLQKEEKYLKKVEKKKKKKQGHCFADRLFQA